jgi:phytoene synthase
MTAQVQQPGDARPAAARAGGSSFYLAMRILGREQREAMFEIYSFCRAVDDIADGDVPGDKLALLAAWRENIDALYSGQVPPGLEGLAKAISRYALVKGDFLAVIDGVEMDARADIRVPSLEELDLYCDRVACAVGRLSVRVFGLGESDGKMLAHHLGRRSKSPTYYAISTKMLGIDASISLAKHCSSPGSTQLFPNPPLDPRLGRHARFFAERARGHFTKAKLYGQVFAPQRPRLKIMGVVYRQMLEDMIAALPTSPRQPVHVNKSQLIWIALRHAFV